MNYKKLFINTILIFIISSIIHFTYTTIPCFFTSIFAPVNESIAEHVKMLFSAGMFFTFIAYFFKRENNIILRSYLRSMLLVIILLFLYLPIYYIFGENMIVTFIILFISIFLTEVIMSLLKFDVEYTKLNILAVILIIVNYILFTAWTYNPPRVDVFFDHDNKKYGIDILDNGVS